MAINSAINPVVASGGTGDATLLNHGVLVGAGTSPITALAVGAANSMLMGNASADPAFTTTGTPYVTSISFDSGTNTFDTYSTASWTPTYVVSGGTGVTYTTQSGIYYKFGKLVFLTFNMTLSNKGTGTTAVSIGGLPFSINNTILVKAAINIEIYAQNTIVAFLNFNTSTTAQLFGCQSAGATGAIVAFNTINNTTAFTGSFYYIST